MTKISVAWLAVLAVVCVIVFFSYQIAAAAAAPERVQSMQSGSVEVERKTVRFALEPPVVQTAQAQTPQQELQSAVLSQEAPMTLPQVPGQTAEDLRMDEPLRATPPATRYDPPDATDPLNGVAFQDAEFGSNLRHPEQMIERRPKRLPPTAPGVAASRSSPGGNNAQGYSTEMVQNGGDFMGAILAYDGSEVGPAYSLI
jgi:hypothetical protein